MSEYTPTTDQVRQIYTQMCELAACIGERPFGGAGSFDRWLANHDRKVAAKALKEAAQDSQMGPVAYGWSASGISSWLKARAEQIERGAGE